MLADGIDPIGAKNQAKTDALIKGRTFESVALGWHTEMSAKWAPDYSKTVMSRLKTHLFPLIGARAIVDLDTHDLMRPLDAIKEARNDRHCFKGTKLPAEHHARGKAPPAYHRKPCLRPRRLDQSLAGRPPPRLILIALA